MTDLNRQDVIRRIQYEFDNNHPITYHGIVTLHDEATALTGWFTAKELRQIAEYMDDIKEVIQKGGF